MRAAADRLIAAVRRLVSVLYRVSPMPVRRFAISVIAPTYAVGAVLMIQREDGRILLVKQRHTGMWAFPGGLVRRGETTAQAAVREANEEVGIEVDAAELGTPATVVDPVRRLVDVIFPYLVSAEFEATRADPVEVTRLGWFAVDAPPTLTGPTAAMLKAALDTGVG